MQQENNETSPEKLSAFQKALLRRDSVRIVFETTSIAERKSFEELSEKVYNFIVDDKELDVIDKFEFKKPKRADAQPITKQGDSK